MLVSGGLAHLPILGSFFAEDDIPLQYRFIVIVVALLISMVDRHNRPYRHLRP
jgi:Flp pilus assembly secretin CpaC